MKKTLLVCLLCLGFSALGQKYFWANKIVDFSSERVAINGGNAYNSVQILGKPIRFDESGEDSPSAWSSTSPDSPGEEFIKVSFEKPLFAKNLCIVENFNAGAISRVEIADPNDISKIVYEATAKPISNLGRILNIKLDGTIQVASVKIVQNCDKVPGYNQLDAVGLSEGLEDFSLGINQVKIGNEKLIKEVLGPEINSPIQEVAPVVSKDGRELYFTRFEFKKKNNIEYPDKQVIYESHLDGNGRFTAATKLPPNINNKQYNAVIGLNVDNTKLFQMNYINDRGETENGLSVSTREKGKWSDPKQIKIQNFIDVSDKQYREYSMSADEKELIVAFTGKATQGEKDLYICHKTGEYEYSEPLNLGPVINTDLSEGMPFLASDNKTLYFTSYGHKGLGLGDIFYSKRLDDSWTNWSEPVNLGKPINSASWDGYISFAANADLAYMSSRVGDHSDIFRIKIPNSAKPEVSVLLSGFVQNNTTKEKVSTEIVAEYIDPADGQTKSIKGIYNKEIGEYKLILPTKYNYVLTAQKEGFISLTESLDLRREMRYREIKKNFTMVPISVGSSLVLNNLYFEQGSDQILEISNFEITRLKDMLVSNPNLEVRLEGHTDNQGDMMENIKLSARRVENIKRMLHGLGIESSRIDTKSWGGAKPIASNSTEETRKKNRRVEVIITKI